MEESRLGKGELSFCEGATYMQRVQISHGLRKQIGQGRGDGRLCLVVGHLLAIACHIQVELCGAPTTLWEADVPVLL